MKKNKKLYLKNRKLYLKNKKAFSLVELIIATVILTIGVFWISALLTNTQNNINNIQEYSKKEALFYSVFECFKSEKNFFNLNNSEKYWVNFWTNLTDCNIILNWITKTVINGLDYYFKAEIIEKTSNEIKVKIFVNDKEKLFKIFK